MPQLLSDGDFAFIYGPNSVPIEQLPLATGTPTSTPAIATLSNIGTPDTGATTLITDHLGSVRALIGTTGTVAGVEAAFTYDTYGQPHALAGMSLAALGPLGSSPPPGPIGDTPGGPAAGGSSALTPLGFTGAYTDGQTGLEYLTHRFYDPTTGTFLSVDPLVGITGDPYGYVSGDPVNGVDPLGLRGVGAGPACMLQRSASTNQCLRKFEAKEAYQEKYGVTAFCVNGEEGGGPAGWGSFCIGFVGSTPFAMESAGGGGSPAGSLTFGIMGGTAKCPAVLGGNSVQIGGSGGEGLVVGGTVSHSTSRGGVTVSEGQIGGGLDLPLPGSAEGGVTHSWVQSW